MSVPLSLSGKIALVSGGSRGIGAATVRMFAAAGAKVAFSYRRARVQAEALAGEFGAASCFPIAAELASAGIYVNCVAPGWVDTDMSKEALEDPSSGEEIRHTIPMGRVGRPEEIAGPVLFLCTEHASFITGEIFNVNGGAVLVG